MLTICTQTSCSNKNLQDDYPQLAKDNIIKEIDGETFLKKISNKESFLIVMGFPMCPWCQALLPFLNDTAKAKKVKEIFYLDIKDMRDNEDSKDAIYYAAIYTYFNEALDKEKDRINAPTTIAIKEGKMVGFNIGTVESHIKDEAGNLPTMTEIEKSELVQIISHLCDLI